MPGWLGRVLQGRPPARAAVAPMQHHNFPFAEGNEGKGRHQVQALPFLFNRHQDQTFAGAHGYKMQLNQATRASRPGTSTRK
ncbi:hypothetical protein B0G38_002540 [Arthrobacter sp. VKM Ac-2550]|nr:hypothetical protein [Arthrobacter sp. VKM Ac-2550]